MYEELFAWPRVVADFLEETGVHGRFLAAFLEACFEKCETEFWLRSHCRVHNFNDEAALGLPGTAHAWSPPLS